MPPLLGLLLLAVAGTVRGPAPLPPPVTGLFLCTPETVAVNGGPPRPSAHPLVEALEQATPGSFVSLSPGEYEPFTIGLGNRAWNDADTSGGLAGLPIVVDGGGSARIRGGDGDAIGVYQKRRNGHITFRGLEIHAGGRSGLMFTQGPPGQAHVGFTFEDCDVLGDYDHLAGRGRNSKWGVWGHQLKEFRFAGLRRPARVEGIRREHGFYLLNPLGRIEIENVRASGLGRTFLQLTARKGQGPAGRGPILVRRCEVHDVGVSRDDGFKGGSAFTVAGRIQGEIRFEDNTYRAGFDPAWRLLTRGGSPYGTGALVAWQGKEEEPNGTLILRGNDFRFAPGCGDRPVVAIGGCTRVLLEEGNRFESGGEEPALALDPVDGAGRPVSPPNGRVRVAPGNRFVGPVLSGAVELDEAGLQELERAR